MAPYSNTALSSLSWCTRDELLGIALQDEDSRVTIKRERPRRCSVSVRPSTFNKAYTRWESQMPTSRQHGRPTRVFPIDTAISSSLLQNQESLVRGGRKDS